MLVRRNVFSSREERFAEDGRGGRKAPHGRKNGISLSAFVLLPCVCQLPKIITIRRSDNLCRFTRSAFPLSTKNIAVKEHPGAHFAGYPTPINHPGSAGWHHSAAAQTAHFAYGTPQGHSPNGASGNPMCPTYKWMQVKRSAPKVGKSHRFGDLVTVFKAMFYKDRIGLFL